MKFMEFLKAYDGEERTVLAVQIENEMGYANTDRIIPVWRTGIMKNLCRRL